VPLAAGDLVVVELSDIGGLRRFGTAFVADSGRIVVSFRPDDFRIVGASKPGDVTRDMVRESKQIAKFTSEEHVDQRRIPTPQKVPHRSQFMWGEGNHCIIATIVRPDMIQTVVEGKLAD
jgi:hypothetical protein